MVGSASAKTLTLREAFDAMRLYLEHHWEVYGEDFGPLVLSEIDYDSVDEHGAPPTSDPGAYHEWLEFVARVLKTDDEE